MIENRRPSAPWLALAVLALGLFMTLLDLTIVNVAIPSIVDDLRASLDQILWVLNGYSLMYAVLLITSGRLGDIFGPRNMFGAGIVVFTIASAFSGLAQAATLTTGGKTFRIDYAGGTGNDAVLSYLNPLTVTNLNDSACSAISW